MRQQGIRPVFVEFIPKDLEEGVLYISDTYKVAVHRCASGCGEKVVTPLSPADWQLRAKGTLVSLYPSIGNWKFACRSHYWIRNNRIVWAATLSEAEIARVQVQDRTDKARYIDRVNAAKEAPAKANDRSKRSRTERSWWQTILRFLGGK